MPRNQHYYWLIPVLAFSVLFLAGPVWGAPPPGVNINRNEYSTKIRRVTLYLSAPADTRYMKISKMIDFSDAEWETYQPIRTWYLDYGAGAQTVYVRFKNPKGQVSEIYKDFIQLDPPAQMAVEFTINNNDEETDSRYVQLKIKYAEGVEGMIISNTGDFAGVPFSDVRESTDWVLSGGSGAKTVYIQFKDSGGKIKNVSDQIIYRQPDNYLGEGSLLKGAGSAIYYLGYDGRLHPFTHSIIYHSWYQDFSNLRYVSDAKLREYQVGEPVCARPGTWLIKFKTSSRVYAVEPGCQLRPLRSEVEAYLFYGKNWGKRVIALDDIYQGGYRFISYSVADKIKGTRDRDSDGIADTVEIDYGTSDSDYDSDNDSLSDYEEMNFWFTDPSRADSDKDGYQDGQEILGGYLPAGPGQLSKVPDGTYTYPLGSLVRSASDGKLYYRAFDGNYYYAGKNTSDKLFTSNRLEERFIVSSPYTINFYTNKNKKVGSGQAELVRPMKISGSALNQL